jgi:hypothetical protein
VLRLAGSKGSQRRNDQTARDKNAKTYLYTQGLSVELPGAYDDKEGKQGGTDVWS